MPVEALRGEGQCCIWNLTWLKGGCLWSLGPGFFIIVLLLIFNVFFWGGVSCLHSSVMGSGGEAKSLE